MKTNVVIATIVVGLNACTATTQTALAPLAAPTRETVEAVAIPPLPEMEPFSAAQVAFFQKSFPEGTTFSPRSIPQEMLASEDKGNETYAAARDQQGKLIGYIRDFKGPLLATQAEPTVAVTFAFDANLELLTLMPTAPLPKDAEGAILADGDLPQLINIAKAPTLALLAIAKPADTIDANGAVKPEIVGAVVTGAARLSRRIAGLAQESRRLITQSPGVWDKRRLQQVMASAVNSASLAHALAELLPTLDDPEIRRAVYQSIAKSYIEALTIDPSRTREAEDAIVEAQLINPPLDPTKVNDEIAHTCFLLARNDLRRPLVERCIIQLRSASSHPADPARIARLVGTAHFVAGNLAAAVSPLVQACGAIHIDRDPELHLQLVLAAISTGKGTQYCGTAQELFQAHPMLPRTSEALSACGPDRVLELTEKIRTNQKRELLDRQRESDTPAPALSLEDDQMQPVEVSAGEANMISVWVFFSTWCPHCASELPRINAFVRATEQSPKMRGRVHVLGIRTAVEKERIPYATFLERTKPTFRILTDATFSMAFSRFAKTQGVRPELPTVAVLDSDGRVRYFLAPGDYRDTARELTWAVESLLK